MTRFSSSKDQGYRNIRDQLLIWAMEIESEADAGADAGDDADSTQKASRGSSHVYSGSVNSNGGQVIQGDLTSSGDFNLNCKR